MKRTQYAVEVQNINKTVGAVTKIADRYLLDPYRDRIDVSDPENPELVMTEYKRRKMISSLKELRIFGSLPVNLKIRD